MPTQRPRMALTLSAETDAAVRALAAAYGRPAATVLSELLDELVPQFEGLTRLAIAAKSNNRAAMRRALTEMMGTAMAEMVTAQQPELFGAKKK